MEADGAELHVINVRCVVDALDEQRSEIVRYPSGRVLDIPTPVFFEERLHGIALFKIPQLLRGPTYLGESVVDRISSSALTGLRFELVFES